MLAVVNPRKVKVGDRREVSPGRFVEAVAVLSQTNIKVNLYEDEDLVETYEGLHSITFLEYDFLHSPVVDYKDLVATEKMQPLKHMTLRIGGHVGVFIQASVEAKHLVYNVLFDNNVLVQYVEPKDLQSDRNPLIYRVESNLFEMLDYMEQDNLKGFNLRFAQDNMDYVYEIESIKYTTRSKDKVYLKYGNIHFCVRIKNLMQYIEDGNVKPEDMLALQGSFFGAYKKYTDDYKVIVVGAKDGNVSCVDSDGYLFYGMTLEQFIISNREDLSSMQILADENKIISLDATVTRQGFRYVKDNVAWCGGRWLVTHQCPVCTFYDVSLYGDMFFYSDECNQLEEDYFVGSDYMVNEIDKIVFKKQKRAKASKPKQEESVADECPFDEDVPPKKTEQKSKSKKESVPMAGINMDLFYQATGSKDVPEKKEEPKTQVYTSLTLGMIYSHKVYGELRIVQSPDKEGLVTGVDSENMPHMGLEVADFV